MKWSFPHLPESYASTSHRSPEPAAPAPWQPATYESGQPSVDYAVGAPTNYTARYAYPLIVWFHDAGGSERDVLEWLGRLSPQNYVGLGLRGPLPVHDGLPGERTWSLGEQHLHWLEDQLLLTLRDVSRKYALHPERIVAAGMGRGATLALQMLLRRPDVFAAAACLNAELAPDQPLDRWGQYSGRGLWLGHSWSLGCGTTRPAIASARLLQTAGMQVCPHLYADDVWPLDALGRDIDHWLMPVLCGDTLIA